MLGALAPGGQFGAASADWVTSTDNVIESPEGKGISVLLDGCSFEA